MNNKEKYEEGIPFFPKHLLKEVSMGFLIVALLFLLVALTPAHLSSKADPLNTPAHIKPEWYFLAVYQLLKLVPKALGILAQGIALAVLFLWPFFDLTLERNPLKRPLFFTLSLLGIIITIILSIWGQIS